MLQCIFYFNRRMQILKASNKYVRDDYEDSSETELLNYKTIRN